MSVLQIPPRPAVRKSVPPRPLCSWCLPLIPAPAPASRLHPHPVLTPGWFPNPQPCLPPDKYFLATEHRSIRLSFQPGERGRRPHIIPPNVARGTSLLQDLQGLCFLGNEIWKAPSGSSPRGLSCPRAGWYSVVTSCHRHIETLPSCCSLNTPSTCHSLLCPLSACPEPSPLKAAWPTQPSSAITSHTDSPC